MQPSLESLENINDVEHFDKAKNIYQKLIKQVPAQEVYDRYKSPMLLEILGTLPIFSMIISDHVLQYSEIREKIIRLHKSLNIKSKIV